MSPLSSSPTGKRGSEHHSDLDHIQPATSIPISPELFAQLYLQPQNKVKGELRKTFGNPTPIALAGFLLSSTPASMALLGWQGSGGFAAAANVGAYIMFGGILMILGGLGEWILGNTFPSTVFLTFGAFWSTFASIIVPDSGAYSTYSTTGTAADGLSEPQFYATFAFFLVAMVILCIVFAVASSRTNFAFFSIFILLIPCLSCLSASFFAVSRGDTGKANTYQHAGAGLLLALSFVGWYIFTSVLLLSVDFPFVLPLGDLSTIVPSHSQPKKEVVNGA
ncbi:hypothetical protein F66182_1173 [Fusarium sp. NRRL 66182]|nr:hypothetical protein F66182_1173 [Fusarium sp. NRRL 66182]